MSVCLRVLSIVIAFSAVVLVTGCGGSALAPGSAPARVASPARQAPSLHEPALIAFDSSSGSLGYWPIRPGGGTKLTRISGPLGVAYGNGLAANGKVVVITNYQPAEILTYDVKSKAQKTIVDPYGGPFDVAIDRHGTIYAMDHTSVGVFKAGSNPKQLACPRIDNAVAVAVNNEGDVFLAGYGPASFAGVIEFSSRSGTCSVPHLRPVLGYIAGVGVNPKTDDLIVIDNPDYCAGGIEGRMLVYPKPYGRRRALRRVLPTTYCAARFRLGATSTQIFYADSSVSAGLTLVDQAQYPSGKYQAQYSNGSTSAGNFAGFTTIPNTLPN